MADVYVSVDVETTGPTPRLGELLTIGASAYGETLDTVATLYLRLRPEVDDEWRWDLDTKAWWQSQRPSVLAEAVGRGEDRMPRKEAAEVLRQWTEKLPGKPVFVAHPVGFDWAWINDLLLEHGANPFGHRPLCLRALAWATGDCAEWGKDRAHDSEFHVPSEVPHHAMYDAAAQGESLVRVLRYLRAQHTDVKASPLTDKNA